MSASLASSLFRSYRALDRRIWIIAATRAINTMGFSIVMPFMAMYLVDQRHATGVLYGSMYLASGLTAALGNGFAGELSDRVGRRNIMLLSMGLRALNLVALGVAVMREAPLAVLGGLIILNGLLRSMFDPAAAAAVTEMCDVRHRTAAYGLQRIGVNLGWAAGPAMGGALATGYSYGSLFFVAAAITVGASAALARIRSWPPPAPREPEGEPWSIATIADALRRHRRFFIYLGLVFLGAMMTVQQFATMSVYVKTELHLTERTIGLLYTLNGVLVVLLQIPAVRFIDAGGPRRALVLGPLLYLAAFLAIGSASGFGGLAFAMVVMTAGEVVFAPALTDMAAHLGDPKHLGRAFGLFGLMQQLGVSMGPLAGGLAYDHLRHQHLVMWGLFAGGMGLLGVGYAAFARRYRLGWAAAEAADGRA